MALTQFRAKEQSLMEPWLRALRCFGRVLSVVPLVFRVGLAGT